MQVLSLILVALFVVLNAVVDVIAASSTRSSVAGGVDA